MRELTIPKFENDLWIMQNSGVTVGTSPPLRSFEFGGFSIRGGVEKPSEWAEYVRKNYNAWKDSQETAKDRKAADVRGAHIGEASAARDTGGSGVPVPSDVSEVKEALVRGIESTLASLAGRAEALNDKYNELETHMNEVRSSLANVADMVDYYNKLLENIKAT